MLKPKRELTPDEKRKISRRNLIKNAIGLGIIGVGAYEYGSRHRLQIRHETLALPKWKANGFKLAFLSDFHVNYEGEIEPSLEAIRLAVQEKPDVLLLGGDYLNFPSSLPHVERWLREVETAAIPAFAVLGNHDYWSESVPSLIERFQMSAIRLLRNEVVRVDGVAIFGIDDGLVNRDRHTVFQEMDDTGSNLALFHEPDFVERVDPRISLMLAGHSHGGQVCWPFGKPALLPKGARKYWDGFYPDAAVPLFVSKGVGMTGPRVRLFCPPDISILTLKSA